MKQRKRTMKNRSTVMQGLSVGIGLFLYNAVIDPLISDTGFASGIREGAIAGAVAIALFAVVAAVRPAKDDESAR